MRVMFRISGLIILACSLLGLDGQPIRRIMCAVRYVKATSDPVRIDG